MIGHVYSGVKGGRSLNFFLKPSLQSISSVTFHVYDWEHLTWKTHNLFEDGTTDIPHGNTEAFLIVETSAKLQPLQLGRVLGSLQSHSQ